MKKSYLLYLLLVSFVFAKSQTVFITEQNYQDLKANGKLASNINYKFINGQTNTQAKKTNTTIKLSAAKTFSSVACQCLIPIDPTFSVVPMSGSLAPDYRSDDGSSGLIPLGFNFCYYGTTYTSCYINNNGNISFGSSYPAFSSNSFPDPNFVMIAPFWGDVDTQNPMSGLVYFKQTATSMIIKWNNVGYYSSMSDKLNDFQLIITNGLDTLAPGGNNVSFCYGDMQWTTGAASMGINGFGGIPATVGINKGDSTNYFQIGRFSAPGIGYNGPYNANDSVDVLDNMQFVFNTCNLNNLAPFTTANICDTTIVSPFQIVTGEVYVYSPEINQSVTVNYSEQAFKTSSNAFSIISTQTVQGGAIIHYQFDASQVAPGSRIVANISGSDNYSTSATYNRNLYFKVGNIVTGITEKEIVEKPFIFPNPATKTFFVSTSSEKLVVKLFDAFGNEVIEKKFENFDERILSIDKLADGYYFAKIYSNQLLIRTQKVIINN